MVTDTLPVIGLGRKSQETDDVWKNLVWGKLYVEGDGPYRKGRQMDPEEGRRPQVSYQEETFQKELQGTNGGRTRHEV